VMANKKFVVIEWDHDEVIVNEMSIDDIRILLRNRGGFQDGIVIVDGKLVKGLWDTVNLKELEKM
jgi:hypothetical protein